MLIRWIMPPQTAYQDCHSSIASFKSTLRQEYTGGISSGNCATSWLTGVNSLEFHSNTCFCCFAELIIDLYCLMHALDIRDISIDNASQLRLPCFFDLEVAYFGGSCGDVHFKYAYFICQYRWLILAQIEFLGAGCRRLIRQLKRTSSWSFRTTCNGSGRTELLWILVDIIFMFSVVSCCNHYACMLLQRQSWPPQLHCWQWIGLYFDVYWNSVTI